jgi:hypothetical protein
VIKETIERVNQLRQKAMKDPKFLEVAAVHAEAIKQASEPVLVTKKKRKASPKTKTLADVYQPYFEEEKQH